MIVLLKTVWEFLTAPLTAIFKHLKQTSEKSEQEQKSIKTGIQALLRDRIIQAYNHYMDKGFCPIYALENILCMYREYKALGGNGAVDQLVAELKQLRRNQTKEDNKNE